MADQERLERYAAELVEHGVETLFDLGFGDPVEALVELVARHRADLVVVGSHGHSAVGGFVHGTSVERLRRRLPVPVLAVPPSSMEETR
jgi:manganese transport protein